MWERFFLVVDDVECADTLDVWWLFVEELERIVDLRLTLGMLRFGGDS